MQRYAFSKDCVILCYFTSWYLQGHVVFDVHFWEDLGDSEDGACKQASEVC